MIDEILIPLTSQDALLLKIVLFLVMFIYFPYLSILIGTSTVSILFNFIGQKKKGTFHLRFAKELAERFILNRGVLLGLGLMPIIMIMVTYAQILQGMSIFTLLFFIEGFFFLSIGFLILNSYKHTFYVSGILKSLKKEFDISHKHNVDPQVVDDYHQYFEKNKEDHVSASVYGLPFLYVGYFAILGGFFAVLDYDSWGDNISVFQLMFFSGAFWAKALLFLVMSFAISGAAMLLGFFHWPTHRDKFEEEEAEFIRKFSVRLAFFSAIATPLFLIINVMSMPGKSISPTTYLISGVILVLFLVISSLLFKIYQEGKTKASATVFVLFIFVFLFVAIGEHVSRDNVIKSKLDALIQKNAKEEVSSH